MKKTSFVSVHGGHSGQFCHHATDSLEEIILLYIEKGFSWVGITEHAPPVSDAFLYPCEREAGLTPESSLKIFGEFMVECRRLQKKHSSKIEIFTAMEIETCSGYQEFIPFLIKKFRPDYIVGSIHFVDDIGFDYSREEYDIAVKTVGGKDELYCRYFDQQYTMLKLLKPAVVGHFDLIRIFDAEYKKRLQHPEILNRIERNLVLIKELDLIMDFNLRALFKGADEPYISRVILEMARKLKIPVVPGDDSHGLNSVGNSMEEGIAILAELGFDTHWRKPSKIDY
ncbi:MAG TPA: histidinol-phosphatase HisJ family protein [Desulfobacterales bacterium]|nr:histidinol-phosphatase HisJ family protein [Desulfobacterales bacterium]HIP39289.1 histidinol-phosphatase HisJ family protein [Desulfocapsa sulfexigens]